MLWRADLKDGLPQKQEGEMRNAGRVLYTALKVPGASGVLLKDDWFLTARHAVKIWPTKQLTVELPERGGRFKVLEKHLHPDADLALLKLERAPKAEALAMQNGAKPEPGTRLWLGGYGAAGPAGNMKEAGKFRTGYNRLSKHEGKRAAFHFDKPGSPNADALECFPGMNDSGSPVFVERDGKWQLFGIVVTVSDAAKPDYGDRGRCVVLDAHRKWLDEVVQKP